MERNIWVFVGGIALIVMSLFLMKYSLSFLLASFILGLGLFVYYEMTVSPEEKEIRRIGRERRKAERRHLEFIEKEARARARGKAYGSKIGYERAKDDIAFKRRPISSGNVLSNFDRDVSNVVGPPLSFPQEKRQKKRGKGGIDSIGFGI